MRHLPTQKFEDHPEKALSWLAENFENKPFMFMGIDVTHSVVKSENARSIAAVVGSMNRSARNLTENTPPSLPLAYLSIPYQLQEKRLEQNTIVLAWPVALPHVGNPVYHSYQRAARDPESGGGAGPEGGDDGSHLPHPLASLVPCDTASAVTKVLHSPHQIRT
eukprot:2457162-Pyramimonas_sp.AAC.2